MIRLLVILLFAVLLLEAKTSVDEKIKKTSSKLDQYSKNHENINKKMLDIAEAIIKQKQEIEIEQVLLIKLREELSDKENSYKENNTLLKELRELEEKLKKDGEKLEEDLAFTIAQSVSLSIILEEEYTASQDSIIEFEVLQLMLKNSKIRIKELNDEFYNNSKNINEISSKVEFLEESIATIDQKRKNLVSTQLKNQEALEKLKIAKASYKKELENVLMKQDTLKRTLSRLNIIKIDEIKKAQEEAQRIEAFNSNAVLSDKNLPKVKKHGSSYQETKTKTYRGQKTIAPFSPYTVTKEYGTYSDPIYGIKVFNESISLKPEKENTKVKTVFNGKVIYADKTAVLDRIVIIEHSDGLHTIYANLSQISPNIVKGKKVKKGYTIGRVNDELIFEVTQESYHINPIRLFQ